MATRVDGSDILFGKRQAPKILKCLDDTASEANKKIRMRGISRGMVCVQESFNKHILKSEQLVCQAYCNKNVEERLDQLYEIGALIKKMWVDVRYMLKQKTLTIGEIGVIAGYTRESQKQLEDWIKSTKDKQCSEKSKYSKTC